MEFPFQIECKKVYTAYAALKGLKYKKWNEISMLLSETELV